MDKKVIVTGGGGFIGSNLVRALCNQDYHVTVLDNFSTGSLKNLEGVACEVIQGDICDNQIVKEITRDADFIFHLAARGSVPRSITEPVEAFNINVLGTQNILESIRNKKTKLIFTSSSSVYGANVLDKKIEKTWTSPLSPYAASKLSCEALIQSYRVAFGINAVIFRLFNVYGPFQRPDMEYSAVIPKWIWESQRNGRISVYGDGSSSRDFTYVDDVVNVLVASLARDFDLDHPINLAFGQGVALSEIVDFLGRRFQNLHIEYLDARKSDVKESLNNPEFIKELFPSIIPVKIRDGLEKTVTWINETFAKDSQYEKNQ